MIELPGFTAELRLAQGCSSVRQQRPPVVCRVHCSFCCSVGLELLCAFKCFFFSSCFHLNVWLIQGSEMSDRIRSDVKITNMCKPRSFAHLHCLPVLLPSTCCGSRSAASHIPARLFIVFKCALWSLLGPDGRGQSSQGACKEEGVNGRKVQEKKREERVDL